MNNSSIYNLIIKRSIEQGFEQGWQESFEQGWLEGFKQGWLEGIERGRHLGGKAFAIEFILEILNERFQVNVVAMLTPALEAIDDLDVFKGLIRSASTAEHLEDFVRTLEHNVNGTQ